MSLSLKSSAPSQVWVTDFWLNSYSRDLFAENIIYAGLRSIDDSERDIARKHNVALPAMADLRQTGVSAWLQEAVMHLSSRCDHIILSIDLDAFSPAIAPAVGTPVDDGFMIDEILPVLSGIVQTHGIELIEIVEFNPELAGAEKTFSLILEILETLLPGKNTLQK